MTIETWVELAVLGLLGWGAFLTLPRAPDRDWERLFKVLLATVIRGEVEARDLPLDQARPEWEGQVRALVPYHPAARDIDAKLLSPDPLHLPVPALSGERALVEVLARLPDASARWRHMMIDDPQGLELLLTDPVEVLGDDPTALLGPEATWDAIAGWDPAVVQGLKRRLGHVVFIGLGLEQADAMRDAVDTELHDLTALSAAVGVPAADDAHPDAGVALAQAILERLPERSDRVVIVARGAHAFSALVALRASELLRDRALAVVSLGGALRQDGRQAWLEQQFTHERMDPELARSIVYMTVIDVLSDESPGDGWAAQRLTEPLRPPSDRRSIEVIDLGPLPLDRVGGHRLARALWVLLAFRLG